MSNETECYQAVYSSSDVADLLKIQESTLRKYCLILEKQDYEILKNEHGHRAFFDDDIIVLRKFLNLKSNADMTLEEAAKSVVAWKNGNDITEIDTEGKGYVARYKDLLEGFENFKIEQAEFNQTLLNELKRQQEYIDNRLEQRDQALMLALKETLEIKKQISIAQEEKRKSWWKFWKS